MADRTLIEQFLRINGVHADSPDGELRTLFHEAGWSDGETDAALAALKHRGADSPQHAPPADLSDRISALLGIEVIVDPSMVRDRETHKLVKDRKPFLARFGIWLALLGVAVGLAFLAGWCTFYLMELGPFKPPVEAYSL